MTMLRSLCLAAAVGLPATASAQPAPPPDALRTVATVLDVASDVSGAARWAGSPAGLAASDALRAGDVLVLTLTPDGLRAAPVGDEPVTEPSALILYVDGRWTLRSLSPGDVPSEEARRPTAHVSRLAPPRPPVAPRRPVEVVQIGGGTDIFELDRQPEAPAATFSVSGLLDGDPAPFLVELSESGALRSLSATDAGPSRRTDGAAGPASGSRTRVEATFGFGSVAEWARWRASAPAEAMMARFGETARTQLDARRAGR